MPHAQEVLEYLAPKYNLYILSNGFQELQCHKMRSAGIDHYFKKVVLSDDTFISVTHIEVQSTIMHHRCRISGKLIRHYRITFRNKLHFITFLAASA